MPNLFLQTPANPGAAFWGPPGGGGGDEIVSVLDDASLGLDSVETQNVSCTDENATLTLPQVSSAQNVLYRLFYDGAGESSLNIEAAPGDSIAGAGGAPFLDFGESVTLIHNGVDTWYLFAGGARVR